MGADPLDALAQRICADHGYELVRAGNSGAFKKTFHVRKDGQDHALKLLTKPQNPERLLREIQALAVCDHGNICRLREVKRQNIAGVDLLYFVEEYISGGTLTERLQHGLLSDAETRTLVLAISEAIAHLDERRIVHRDIKPDNIMYKADGTPVLVDLGIARHLDAPSLTQTWAPMGPGTPAYAAPEQLLNDKHLIDWRTDQFALGVTISVAALGMHPYTGDLDFDTARLCVAGRQSRAAAFRAAVAANSLEPLIRMTEQWPVKRYARPEDLIQAWK